MTCCGKKTEKGKEKQVVGDVGGNFRSAPWECRLGKGLEGERALAIDSEGGSKPCAFGEDEKADGVAGAEMGLGKGVPQRCWYGGWRGEREGFQLWEGGT